MRNVLHRDSVLDFSNASPVSPSVRSSDSSTTTRNDTEHNPVVTHDHSYPWPNTVVDNHSSMLTDDTIQIEHVPYRDTLSRNMYDEVGTPRGKSNPTRTSTSTWNSVTCSTTIPNETTPPDVNEYTMSFIKLCRTQPCLTHQHI